MKIKSAVVGTACALLAGCFVTVDEHPARGGYYSTPHRTVYPSSVTPDYDRPYLQPDSRRYQRRQYYYDD